MAKKEFKLKYPRIVDQWNYTYNELNHHIGTRYNGCWGYYSDNGYDTYYIYNYIPEKHDSIINELILKYG